MNNDINNNKTNNNYGSNNDNLIGTLVESFVDVGGLLVDLSFAAVEKTFNWFLSPWIEEGKEKKEEDELKIRSFSSVKTNSDTFFTNANIRIGFEIPKLINNGEEENYYYFVYELPIGMSVADITNHDDRLATFFNCKKESLRFIAGGSKLIIRIMKPMSSVLYDPIKHKTNNFICPLGFSNDMELVTIDLFDSNNYGSYSAGGAGSGKTRTIRLIIAHLINNVSPKDLEIAINDHKGVDFIEFEECEHVITFITGTENTVKMLQEQEAEMERRYELLASYNKSKNIWKARERGYQMPFRLLVIEEASAFSDDKEYQKAMKNLHERGRAAGIIPISVIQFPNKDNLPSSIKSNCSVKFGHRVDHELRSEVVAGKGSGLEKLRGRGHNKLFSPDYGEGIEYQEFDLTDEMAEKIGNDNKKKKDIKFKEIVGKNKSKKENTNIVNLNFHKK